MPVVLADEWQVLVVYLLEDRDPDWDGTTVRVVNSASAGVVAIAHFSGVWATQFGAPNDEALDGHPLFACGLRSYGAFTVEPSSWKAELAAAERGSPVSRPPLLPDADALRADLSRQHVRVPGKDGRVRGIGGFDQ